MTGLENVLTVVTNNRKELVVEDEEPQQETAEQAAHCLSLFKCRQQIIH